MKNFNDITSDKAKWLCIKIIAELCSLGQQSEVDLFKQISPNGDYHKQCVEYLHAKSLEAQAQNDGQEAYFKDQTLISAESFCFVENVILSRVGIAEENSNGDFVTLPTRVKILHDMALGIADGKHTLITVSCVIYFWYVSMSSPFSFFE